MRILTFSLRRGRGRVGVQGWCASPFHGGETAATRRLVFSILGGAFYFEGRGSGKNARPEPA
jgi:hypothetical protein